MKKFTQRFLRDNTGVTAIEYGLIAGLIVLAVAVTVGQIGAGIETVFTNILTQVQAAA